MTETRRTVVVGGGIAGLAAAQALAVAGDDVVLLESSPEVGGKLRLAEVAAACGFTDHAHLTRCFTARHGIGPAALRRTGQDERKGTFLTDVR